MVGKVAWGEVFSEYFGFTYQLFHWLLHIHHHPELVQRASSGLNNSELGFTAPQKELKEAVTGIALLIYLLYKTWQAFEVA
jgi:hypothetical protein